MISKELHEKLMKKWAKVQKGAGTYQKWSRMHRLKFFLKFIDRFKGKDVLELGCNAGIYGYEIAKVAKSYVGVDQGDYYIRQAKITQKYIENPSVKFICGKVKDFIKLDLAGEAPKYNALFASFALYHFSDKATERITETILPKCDVVIISTRTSKRKAFKKYNSWRFEKPKNVVKYLKDFKCEIHWAETKKYAVVVAVREKKDTLMIRDEMPVMSKKEREKVEEAMKGISKIKGIMATNRQTGDFYKKKKAKKKVVKK